MLRTRLQTARRYCAWGVLRYQINRSCDPTYGLGGAITRARSTACCTSYHTSISAPVRAAACRISLPAKRHVYSPPWSAITRRPAETKSSSQRRHRLIPQFAAKNEDRGRPSYRSDRAERTPGCGIVRHINDHPKKIKIGHPAAPRSSETARPASRGSSLDVLCRDAV